MPASESIPVPSTWRIISFAANGQTTEVHNEKAFIEIRDGEISASAGSGCNNFNGRWTGTANAMRIDEAMACTRMMPHGDNKTNEDLLSNLLRGTMIAELAGNNLVLNSNSGTSAKLARDTSSATQASIPVPSTWQLLSFTKNGNETKVSSEKAYIKLSANDIHGNVGGNSISRSWTGSVNAMKMSEAGLSTLMMVYDDVERDEKLLHEVFDGTVTSTLEGDSLTLCSSSGTSAKLKKASTAV